MPESMSQASLPTFEITLTALAGVLGKAEAFVAAKKADAAKASALPPTITVNAPFSAPACPPDTGASRKSNPALSAAAESSRATSADEVV